MGPVTCRNVSVIDAAATGAPRFYAVNPKYLIEGGLLADLALLSCAPSREGCAVVGFTNSLHKLTL